MRPWLRWLLFLSLAASATALWWPDGVTQAAVGRIETAMTSPREAGLAAQSAVDSMAGAGSVSVPSRLASMSLEKSDFDPFIGLQPPPSPPTPSVSIPVMAASPPPLPLAPPLTYRYLGQMVDPSGKQYVYLGTGDKEVLVAVGTQLDGGYVVEAIEADGIRVHYPPLDAHAVISVPVTKAASLLP